MTVWITRYVYLHQVTALAFATTYVTHTISHRVMTLKELTNGLQQVFLSLIQFKDKNASGKSFVRPTLSCGLPSIFRATFHANRQKRLSDEEERRRIFI